MTKLFNVYKKDGTKVLDGVESPAKITGLTADTTYPKGEFKVSAIEEGKAESEKIDIPEFKTKVRIVLPMELKADKPTVQVTTGKTETVKVTVLPDNATDKTLVFDNLNSDTAKVTHDGKGLFTIEGVSAGTKTLHVMSQANPAVTLDINIIVEDADLPEPPVEE